MSISRQRCCLVSKKELGRTNRAVLKMGVLREAKIECPMELQYPWMSMIPESGDGITGGGRKTITPIERMHFNLAPGPEHKP
jgi:hypothetical protein